ncbi:MAG: hypothetical protein GY773_16970 [Actinomycetia bacterium]|nr:hypothetical protein [Actinomycetes bacterium]
MTGSDDLSNRVWAASQQRSIDNDIRAMHLARIHSELERPIHVAPTVTSAATLPVTRLWRLAAAAAAFAILPLTAFTAANSAVPGDHMYSMKRAIEQAITVVDNDVRATNRVEELGTLIQRQDHPELIVTAQQGADREIRKLPANHVLATRLNELFIGWGAEDYRLDRAIDWSEGDLFTSSLPDGHLLWISRQIGTQTLVHYELSVSGPWQIVRSQSGWRISNLTADSNSSEASTFDIRVGGERILITAVDIDDQPADPDDHDVVTEEVASPTTTETTEPAPDGSPSSASVGAPDVLAAESPTSSPASVSGTSFGPPTTNTETSSDLTQPPRPHPTMMSATTTIGPEYQSD